MEMQTIKVLEYNPCPIIVARPVKELWYHVKNRELPSLELIIRSIKAIVLSIFRGHMCDRIAIISQDQQNVLHSIRGKRETVGLRNFNKEYTFMSETGFKLVYSRGKPRSDDIKRNPDEVHPSYNIKVEGSNDLVVQLADFSQYKEISAQTICEYYSKFHGIKLTDKETGNTISDLFKSKKLISKEYL